MKKVLSLLMASVMAFMTMSFTVLAADTEVPSDVENLETEAFNGAIKLSWDAATDDTAVKGYQVHYGETAVTQSGQSYDEVVDVGDVLSYVVTDLENGTKYYFSVIAYDAEGNESANWAIEASATPDEDKGDLEDTEAPQVEDAEALNKVEVKVVFTEAVKLPTADPENAFTIENDENFELLPVTDATKDEEDKTGKTVILTTEDQTEGDSYKLTVGVDVEDMFGNPIISGTSDTAIFEGSGESKEEADNEGPEVVTVEPVDNTHIIVNFNETIVLTIDPSEDFSVIQEDDETKKLSVLGVELGTNKQGVEDASAILTTTAQEEVNYIVSVSKLTDESENEVNEAKSSAVFKGVVGEVPLPDGEDTTPPKEVGNFLAKVVTSADKFIVKLTWDVADDSDSVEQIIYQSGDGETYEKETSLEPDVESYDVDGLSSGEYWFKITQKDEKGNESAGIVKKVVLSETGPEMLGLVVLSLALGRFVTKRKK